MLLLVTDALREVERLLGSLSPAEKAEVRDWIVRDLNEATPGIDMTPGVCGGQAVIVRTRIPVWVLEDARRRGATEVDLLQAYPSLRAEDLAHAWAYVLAHGDEIEQLIRDNEAA
jgi:uncharacterized protein (DUF433 family)